MSWPEVQQARESNRYELILNGTTISQRITSRGLDMTLFELSNLNFLRISNTCLEILPEELGKLSELTSLDVHGNKLKSIPTTISSLKALKVLDISGNNLSGLPEGVGKLNCLDTLNLSDNKLTELPPLEELRNLARLDVSKNQLVELPEGTYRLEHLSVIQASHNKINCISVEVRRLPRLRKLDLSDNKVTVVPTELSECAKLKELCLDNNPLTDNRLSKMLKQCSTKSVLDYIAKFYSKESGKKKQGGKKLKGKKMMAEDKSVMEVQPTGPIVKVVHGDQYRVIVEPSVQEVRPFIVCTIIRDLNLCDSSMFKEFIALQTKLHEKVCDQRTTATIATHDLSALKFPLTYCTSNMSDTRLTPLGQDNDVLAEELVVQLKTKASSLKEKSKRNPKTGLYKFLHLVEDTSVCANVKDSDGTVISLPPITNSENSKIKARKQDVLVEVTSSIDLGSCKKVMEALIETILECGFTSDQSSASALECSSGDDAASNGQSTAVNEVKNDAEENLILEQVRVVDSSGQLKVVYPSRADLCLKSVTVKHV